jgi:pseudouridine kinase
MGADRSDARLAALGRHLLAPPAVGAANVPDVAAAPCLAPAAAAAAAAAAATAAAPPVLVGSIIMDIQAMPAPGQVLTPGGSVPGRVEIIPGGVSRNIAHSLALLLRSSPRLPPPLPLLISAVGDDAAGAALLAGWADFGLSTAGIERVPGARTPSVSVIFDAATGDVAASVADVALLERELTPDRLARHRRALQAAQIVLVDGDLSERALAAACRLAGGDGALLLFEPVSAFKAPRAAGVLSLLDFATPNRAELAALADAARQRRRSVSDLGTAPARLRNGRGGAETAAELGLLRPDLDAVLRAGLRHAVVTLGPNGAALCALAADGPGIVVHHAPAAPASVANCSGAGDCLAAGLMHALLEGCAGPEALARGVAAARFAVESRTNVPERITAACVRTAAAVIFERICEYEL